MHRANWVIGLTALFAFANTSACDLPVEEDNAHASPASQAADGADNVCVVHNLSRQDLYLVSDGEDVKLLPSRSSCQLLISDVGCAHVALCRPEQGEGAAQSFLLAGATLKPGDILCWSDKLEDVVNVSVPTDPAGGDAARDVEINKSVELISKLLEARVGHQKDQSFARPFRWKAQMLNRSTNVVGAGSFTITTARKRTQRPYLLTGPGMEFVWVDPGVLDTYAASMGQRAQSTATISTGYWCAITELTRAQAAFVNQDVTPSDPDMPQGGFSWNTASAFIEKLAANVPGASMPTEMQWQLACEAGRGAEFGRAGDPRTFAWAQQVNAKPIAVASLLPNDFGIYDMHGNLYEFCIDYWNIRAHSGVDPVHTSRSAMRARRGGSVVGSPYSWCSCHVRDAVLPDVSDVGNGVRVFINTN